MDDVADEPADGRAEAREAREEAGEVSEQAGAREAAKLLGEPADGEEGALTPRGWP